LPGTVALPFGDDALEAALHTAASSAIARAGWLPA